MSGSCLVWFGVLCLFYSVYEGTCGCSMLWLSELLEWDMGAELLIEIGPSYDGCQMSAGKMAVENITILKARDLVRALSSWI